MEKGDGDWGRDVLVWVRGWDVGVGGWGVAGSERVDGRWFVKEKGMQDGGVSVWCVGRGGVGS